MLVGISAPQNGEEVVYLLVACWKFCDSQIDRLPLAETSIFCHLLQFLIIPCRSFPNLRFMKCSRLMNGNNGARRFSTLLRARFNRASSPNNFKASSSLSKAFSRSPADAYTSPRLRWNWISVGFSLTAISQRSEACSHFRCAREIDNPKKEM